MNKQGTKRWRLNGKLHRTDGPAVIWVDGLNEWCEEWWLNGKRHRTDGPAVIWFDGLKEWWVNGKQVTEDEVMKSLNEC